MTKSDIFKDKFPGFKGEVDACKSDQWGDTSEVLDFIDVPNNQVRYTYYFVEQCGCCHGRDEDTETLEFMLDDMTEGEFKELCEDVVKRL
jgi:hypothetical protein